MSSNQVHIDPGGLKPVTEPTDERLNQNCRSGSGIQGSNLGSELNFSIPMADMASGIVVVKQKS